ncbi:P-loop containing nucleoside triphosphate hydrolase protein [Setomelanomma holmii]|uniref:P-loop containing nucleoside triphosphate hydrolase protein n=1 Tax=Setomelanomma holmii TaxID=210430 RepID=A0A9P4HA69_9PLEO|nr:P-loop containing nucleoside triphosphate hydrolase protein [Setomelanomma holmii]
MVSATCPEELDDRFGPVVDPCLRLFDFTRLFEDSIFGIGLSAVLILATVPRLLYLNRAPSSLSRSDRKRWLLAVLVLSLKTVLAVALLVVSIVLSPLQQSRLATASAALELTASLSLLFLSCVEHKKSERPPVLTSAYLVLDIAFTCVRVRTDWMIPGNRVVAGLRCALLTTALLALIVVSSPRHHTVRGKTSAEQRSGLFGIAFYTWLVPFLIRGYRKEFRSTSELDGIDGVFHGKNTRYDLPIDWSKGSKKQALIRAAALTLRWPLVAPMLPRIIMAAFTYAQPLLLTRTVQFIEHEEKDKSMAYGLVGAYALVYLGLSISSGLYWRGVNRFITHIRGLLIHNIYRKTTTLPSGRSENMEAMALMNTDVERIVVSIRMLHESWATAIEVAVATFLLERQVGRLALAPIAVGLACVSGSAAVSSVAGGRQARWMEALERRIQVTIPVLDSIREIRMLAISPKVEAMIHDLRGREINIARWFRQVIIIAFALAYGPVTLSPAIVFTAYAARVNVSTSETFDAARVFTALSLMNILAVPLITFLQALPQLAGAVANFQRIEDFLSVKTNDDFRRSDAHIEHEKEGHASIQFQNATIGWIDDNATYLRDIDLTIPSSSLTVVYGPSGCGKTTLLKTILGETSLRKGSVGVSSADIAYADQTPWFIKATIRENIVGLGSEKVDEDNYRSSLRACKVETSWVPLGQTISSNMPSLSGGQKQRIALARIAYARKKTVVLDDAFSAMDPLTTRAVFRALCGPQGLLRLAGCTIVLATHSCKYRSYADRLAVLSPCGELSYCGNAKAWLATKEHVVDTTVEVEAASCFSNEEDVFIPPNCESSKEGIPNEMLWERNSSSKTPVLYVQAAVGHQGIYRYYFRALGNGNMAIFVVMCACFTFCLRFPDLWLSWWATANTKTPGQDTGRYIGVYVALQLGALFLVTSWAWSYLNWAIPRSGLIFHQRMIRTAMRATIAYLSTVDTGVTANQFSQDLLLSDSELPGAFVNTAAELASIVAQMIIVAVSFYYICAAYPLIFAVLFGLQHFYLRTAQPLRILDIEAKAPLCTQFIDTIQGLATIRAFGWQGALQQKLDHALRESQKAFYLMLSIQQWLNLVLDLIVTGFAVILVGVSIPLKDVIRPAALGLILSNVISLGENLRNLFLFWTQMETSIGSVKRIRDFVEQTDQERDRKDMVAPSPAWPARGEIRFNSVSVSYRQDKKQPTLSDLCFDVKSGQKIGICGRSGSGKSTLIAALFGLLDLGSGHVTIDGMDVASISRQTLRERLACIPQSPYMLEGSIKMNLTANPSGHEDDASLWSALQKVHLADTIRENGGLDADVAKVHFSKGQLQLLCLARALLNQSRIVVMDEPSSAIDGETDELIRKLIYTELSDRTVLVVSHRMDWMVDVDEVLVLGDGRLLEFGAPAELLQNAEGAFSALQTDRS